MKWIHAVTSLFQRFRKKVRNTILMLKLCSESCLDVARGWGDAFWELTIKSTSLLKAVAGNLNSLQNLLFLRMLSEFNYTTP